MDVLGKLSLGTNKKLAGNCLNTYVLCGVKQSVVPTKDLKKKKNMVGCMAFAPDAF